MTASRNTTVTGTGTATSMAMVVKETTTEAILTTMRSKKRKLKKEISCPSSRKRRELKTKGEEDIREGEEGSRETLESTGNQIKSEDAVYTLPGIPLAPSSNQNMKQGVIFVLEGASLVPAIIGQDHQILDSNKHADFLRKRHMDPYRYRPDIVYQALLKIMKLRPLMAGRIQAIYVKTDEGVLIKVEPHARIPETLGKFCAMMSQLLQKFSIKAKAKREKLLHVIANPVTQHLPVNSLKIGLSFSSPKAFQIEDYVSAVKDDVNLVFVVGAMADRKIDSEYIDDLISVCGYPLCVDECLRLICNALRKKWKI